MVRIGLLLLFVAACRPAGKGEGRRGRSKDKPAPSTVVTPTFDEPPAEPCPGGAPWTGTPIGCTYEVEMCCYPSAELACAAAQCSTDACEVLETSPAQIRCRTQ